MQRITGPQGEEQEILKQLGCLRKRRTSERKFNSACSAGARTGPRGRWRLGAEGRDALLIPRALWVLGDPSQSAG